MKLDELGIRVCILKPLSVRTIAGAIRRVLEGKAS
jgi:hypothetical protein